MSVIQDGNGFNIVPLAKATSAVAVTPNDANAINKTKALYIGGSGDLAVTMADGTNATFKGLLVGNVYHLSVTKVKATGTTATNVLALY